MRLLLATNRVPISIVLGIKTNTPATIVINISSIRKKNTTYINRVETINGYREFNLNLPQSPDGAVVTIFNPAYGNLKANQDPSFKIDKFETEQVQVCPIEMSRDTVSFVKFAQMFCENAGVISGTVNREPSIYRSADGKFQIDYFDQIFDRKTGAVLTTPARIGHSTGVIEVSKKDFAKYTVPMRMIILLHEYAHKYLNPEINMPIAYETGADINALNIYLSLGYSPTEAHYAFLNVFEDANNSGNTKRYKIINDFIDKFTSGKIKGSCKLKTNISVNN